MKGYTKIFFSLIVSIIVIGICTISKAVTPTEAEIEAIVNSHSTIDPENITTDDILEIYDELSNKYTNEELADALEAYSGELKKAGVDEEALKTGEAILRTTDEKELKSIIKDTDFNEIKAEIENSMKSGNSTNSTGDTSSTKATIVILTRVLLANKIVKAILVICILLSIYMIIVRWFLYKKAGKHGWAAIIPIYRDVVWLKIAGISPWFLLLILLPVIGWIALAIIFIVSKFTLPEQFGRSAAWGLGLWFLPIVFESVVAFSKEFKYKGLEK